MEEDDAMNKLKRIAESLYEYDKRVHIVNKTRVDVFNALLELCKAEFDSDIYSVSSELFKPFKDDGSITIKGNEIDMSGKTFFSLAMKVCDNIDIYEENGMVTIDVAFSGMTEAIG